MNKELETILSKSVEEMALGELIVGQVGRIPKGRNARMILLIGLMRSEVHLPNPGLICRDFTPKEQEQIKEELGKMDDRQLALRIKEERQRLNDELSNQWPRGLAHP